MDIPYPTAFCLETLAHYSRLAIKKHFAFNFCAPAAMGLATAVPNTILQKNNVKAVEQFKSKDSLYLIVSLKKTLKISSSS